MSTRLRDRVLRNHNWVFVGVFWLVFSGIMLYYCPVRNDLIITVFGFVPGIIPVLIAVLVDEDIEDIEVYREIRPRWVPALLILFLLACLPLVVLMLSQDSTFYVDSSLMVGGLMFGLSIHFFETANTIISIAMSKQTLETKKTLLKIADKTNIAAMSMTFGSIILVFCGVIYRYPLIEFGTDYSIFISKMTLTLLGDCFFLWGILEAASYSQFYKVKT